MRKGLQNSPRKNNKKETSVKNESFYTLALKVILLDIEDDARCKAKVKAARCRVS